MFVDEGAESQAVPEGRSHVGDGHIPVAVTLDPAPLLQSLHRRHGARSRTGPRESAAVALVELVELSLPSDSKLQKLSTPVPANNRLAVNVLVGITSFGLKERKETGC